MIDKIKKIAQNGVVKDLFSQSIWSTIGSVTARGLLFVTWIIVARILSVSIYGEFSVVRNTTFLFTQFVSLTFGFASAKYIAQYFNRDNKKVERLIGLFLSSSLVIGLILFVMLYTWSGWICENMLNAPNLTIQLKYTSIILLLSSFSGSQMGILSGFNQYKLIAKINITQIVLAFPIFIILTNKYGLGGAVIAYVLFNVLLSVITHYELKNFCTNNLIKISFNFKKDELKMILYYILPYFASVFITMLATWYNESVLVSTKLNGFIDMGYFSAVNLLQIMIVGITIMLCNPFVSIISKYESNENKKLLEKLNFVVPLYLCLFITFFIILFPEIFGLLYGKSYANDLVYRIVVFMSLYTVVIIYKQALSRLVAVYELQSLYLFDSILFSALAVVSFYYLKSMGAIGIVYSYLFSYTVSALLITPFYVRKKMISLSLFKDKYLVILFFVNIISLMMFFLIKDIWIRLSVVGVFVIIFTVYKSITIKNNIKKKY